ncbi:MAG: FxsA family protein [Pseudomonadota bacterium]
MALLILLAFLAIPLLEIYIFIEAGGEIGVWQTVGLTFLTAVIGTFLVRWQGLSVIAKARADMEKRALPVASILDGVGLAIAGFMLITPGFFTDALGFLFLVPPFRRVVLGLIAARLAAKGALHARMHQAGYARSGYARSGEGQANPGSAPRQGKTSGAPCPGVVIDGEFEDLSEAEFDENAKTRSSPWNRLEEQDTTESNPTDRTDDKKAG